MMVAAADVPLRHKVSAITRMVQSQPMASSHHSSGHVLTHIECTDRPPSRRLARLPSMGLDRL